eukprot:GFUD01000280.1.p1 GENE.GFUD01000280.1~~GFUD01000280.1.p1  ORF type:complete len:117 (+),score=22.40 GFUD01000280.1:104-454(+)
MKTYMILLFSVLILPCCLGVIGNDIQQRIMETPDMVSVCIGTLTLYGLDGSETVVTEDVHSMRVTVERVVMEGCGCFTLHSRPTFMGRSYNLRTRGEHSRAETGFGRVKSVERVEC